jgi:hypothetical protein
VVGHWKTAQIGGGELADTEVDEVDLGGLGDCGDSVGLPDAWSPPDHDGLEEVLFNESGEQVLELCWIHFGIFEAKFAGVAGDVTATFCFEESEE